MEKVLFLASIIGVSGILSQIYTPIPLLSEYPGFQLDPSSSGNVTIEAFFDLMCPDSADSWVTVQDVADHYGPEKINIRIHIFQLPYYRNTFLVSQVQFCVTVEAY